MKRSRLVAMLGGLALLGALTVGSVTSVFGATRVGDCHRLCTGHGRE